MTFKIFPLAATQCDWKIYSEQCQKILNTDPLKGLGASYIDRESTCAYLATLDLENHPLQQLREGVYSDSSFHHFSVSFIGSMDSELFFEFLYSFSDIQTLSREVSKNLHFVILTANMFIWHHTVRSALSHQKVCSTDLKHLFHTILIHFERMGFQEVWSKYERILKSDGSLFST